ncbi:hypothetical protein Bra5_PA00135 (plasmid) [Rhizobium phaseoli Brasil 5]|nr:hypothetical protein Bra5_PA00135 [Rhizobium phaseoli Brasil 5]
MQPMAILSSGPASSAARYSHAASGDVRISQIGGDRLDRGESEGLACRAARHRPPHP